MPLKNIEHDATVKDHKFQEKVQNFIEDRCEEIEKLKLTHPSCSLTCNLLENLENLHELTIFGVKSSGGFLVELKNLKILNIQDPACYLKLLMCPELEELSVKDFELDATKLSKSTNNFLKRCDKLKKFSYAGIFPNLEISKFNFKLESFSLFLIFNTSNENLIEFMESQAETLRQIKLSGFLTNELVQISIKMTIVELTVDMDKIFAEFKDLKVNNSIKKLEITKPPNEEEIIQKLIAHCPKIETLIISPPIKRNFCKIMLKISNSLENLKNLTLHSITANPSEEMNFFNLENLTVHQINSEEELVSFIEFSFGCQNVKNIQINNFGGDKSENFTFNTEDLKFFLTDLEMLETLKISGKFKLTKEIFETIKETEKNLKKIQLNVQVGRGNFNKIDEIVRILDDTEVQVVVPELNELRRKIEEEEQEEEEEEEFEDLEETDTEIEDFDEEDFDHFCCDHDHEEEDEEEQEDCDEEEDCEEEESSESEEEEIHLKKRRKTEL